MSASHRLHFAARYALRHLLLSLLVALASAAVVFGLWYPAPYRQMLQVGHIYLLVLVVDVVCGPLLTLIVASPRKSRRERWLDFSLIGAIQLAALAYGMYSVWVARPAVLAFESDRLVVVSHGTLPYIGTPREVFSHGAALEELGLGVPAMNRVFSRVRAMGVDIDPAVYTVEQAKAAFLAAWRKRKEGK